MNKKISLFILIILTLSLFGSNPKPVHAQDWWNNNWSYRITIEIDRDKIEDDFTDFPVLVYLNSSRIDWAHVQNDLDDLRFIDGDDITQLYAELENYTVNSEAWIWVKIPTVYSMGIPETNQLFYLYYGNNAVSSWWNPEDVWEDSSVMVQHMVDNPDNAHIMDSTQYDNDGTKKAANEPLETALGKIDDAQDFDGINDYIDISDSVSLDVTDAVTISVWVKPNLGTTNYILSKYDHVSVSGQKSFLLIMLDDGRIDFVTSSSGSNDYDAITTATCSTGVWSYVVAVYDGTTKKIYINTVSYSTNYNLGIYSGNENIYIGSRRIDDPYFNGYIDEIHIYNEAKSASWILADYNSGADTLLIYGAEELCSLALTILYNTGINKLYINGTERANNTTIYVDKNVNVNATVTMKPNFIFMKYVLGSTGASLISTYIFNMTNPFTLWSYATPNFFIYEEPTTFTFTHWLILLFIALVISLLAAIKFHIIAVVSFILTVFMIINVASYSGMILLAIIAWILTILFSIVAILEI